MQKHKFIISGGGTGGHIFPAVAIADTLRKRLPDCEILFVGAKGRMEMEKVPKAGYPIEGLWISGIQRNLSAQNLLFPFKLLSSLIKANSIIRKFKPDAAVGVGGYASAAILRVATSKKIPALIQEQNSFPGITNKWLAGRVQKICVAYKGMEKYFPQKKLVLTGNPVREEMVNIAGKKEDALAFFELQKDKPVLLITGGSLGARSINQNIAKGIKEILDAGIQVLWQTGKPFYPEAIELQKDHPSLKIHEFIYKMDYAYAVADLLVARAGAITVSELSLVKKPAILVPLPTAAEDHQTKNAMALVEKGAALHIADKNAGEELIPCIIDTMQNEGKRKEIQSALGELAYGNAAEKIVDELLKLIE